MTENLNDKIIIYQSEDGKTQLDVKLEGETVWLTQAQMVELFQSSKATISEHIKHIIEDDELDSNSTVRKFRTVQQEGKRQVSRIVAYYNLDMIISVGYRVNTKRGIRFRQWANSVLKQYLVKGYAINEDIRKHQIAELRQLIQVLGRAIQQNLQRRRTKAMRSLMLWWTIPTHSTHSITMITNDSISLRPPKKNPSMPHTRMQCTK